MMKTRSNTFSTLIISVTATTARTGASSGTVTRRNTCHSLAPSTRAASSSSRGTPASPAAISTIAKPAHIQTYEPMMAGVTSDGPSQSSPLYGSLKLLRREPQPGPVGVTGEGERAVVRDRRRVDDLAVLDRLDPHPGVAQLARVDPAEPADALAAREVLPGRAGDLARVGGRPDRLPRAVRHPVRGDADQGKGDRLPGPHGVPGDEPALLRP